MKVICIQKYQNINVGDIIEFLPRSNIATDSEKLGRFPYGGFIINNNYYWVYYKEYSTHFCTMSQNRKIKLLKIKNKYY